MFNDVAWLPSSYRWWLAFACTLLAAIVFSPQVFIATGYVSEGFGFNPQVNLSGAPTVGLFLFLALIYFLLIRLMYEWVPLSCYDRWRYATITTVLALLLFAPFLTSIITNLVSPSGECSYSGVIFGVELVVFLLLVRLSLL